MLLDTEMNLRRIKASSEIALLLKKLPAGPQGPILIGFLITARPLIIFDHTRIRAITPNKLSVGVDPTSQAKREPEPGSAIAS